MILFFLMVHTFQIGLSTAGASMFQCHFIRNRKIISVGTGLSNRIHQSGTTILSIVRNPARKIGLQPCRCSLPILSVLLKFSPFSRFSRVFTDGFEPIPARGFGPLSCALNCLIKGVSRFRHNPLPTVIFFEIPLRRLVSKSSCPGKGTRVRIPPSPPKSLLA